jgi:hypothetical protein
MKLGQAATLERHAAEDIGGEIKSDVTRVMVVGRFNWAKALTPCVHGVH